MIDQKRAIAHLERLSKEYDHLVLLTYSISSTLLEKLLTIGKLKDFRLMYSVMSKTRNPIVHLQKFKDKIKQVETDFDLDRYERSHAKIYLFAKYVGKRIELRAVIGSFNLTYQGSVELYGDYKGEFSDEHEHGNLMDLFEKPPDTKHLMEIFSGDSAVLDALSLLLTHWHNKDLLIKSDDKRFVTTFGTNSLKTSLISEIEKSIQTGKKFGESLDILIVSPFHSLEAISNFFDEIKRAMERLGCEVQYQVRLLTNGYYFTLESDGEAFTDPSLLRRLTGDHPFSIKFWGTPSDEPIDHGNRLHLKLFTLNVGRVHKVLVTSANWTNSGLGYDPKNLEVGVWERNTYEAHRIFETADELWGAEVIPNEEIWKSLEKWYSGYEGQEEVPGFSINGLADEIHIEDKINLEVKTHKEVSIKGILSFINVPAETLLFKKKGGIHRASFVVKRSHVGKMDLDLYAKTKDGKYYRIKHKRIKILEKFPTIKVKNILDRESGLLRVKLEIERGIAFEELHATEFGFEKSEPLAIKIKKTRTEKSVEIILPIKTVRVTYRNEWSHRFDIKAEEIPNNYTNFHQTKSVHILTDKRTICPRKPIRLELKFDQSFLEKLGLRCVQAVRTAEYYDYYSSTRSRKKKTDILELDNKVELDNEFQIPSRAENVSCELYATNHRGDLLIPLGKVDYEIFKNPPEITVEHSPIRTNITLLATNFVLDEDRDIDVVYLKYGFGDYKNKIEIDRKDEPLKLGVLEKVSKDELKKGLSFNARFKFLFNVADEIIEGHLEFHFYANPCDRLIWNKEDPPNILNQKPFHSIDIACLDGSVPTVHLRWNNNVLKLPITGSSVRVPFPKTILKSFNEKWDIKRHQDAQLVFSIKGVGKITLDIGFSYLTIERENYIPKTGSGCRDAVIVGPERFDHITSRIDEITKIATSVFQRDLSIHLSNPNLVEHKEVFDHLIQRLRSGEYVPNYLSEAEQGIRRYNAPSKVRRMADVLAVNHKLDRGWYIRIK